MTRAEALELAGAIRDALPVRLRQRLKAVHISPHLHSGHTTVRIFTVSLTAEDPEAFVFLAEEL